MTFLASNRVYMLRFLFCHGIHFDIFVYVGLIRIVNLTKVRELIKIGQTYARTAAVKHLLLCEKVIRIPRAVTKPLA